MSRNIWRAYDGEKYRIGEKDENFSLQSYLLVDNKRKLMNEFVRYLKVVIYINAILIFVFLLLKK